MATPSSSAISWRGPETGETRLQIRHRPVRPELARSVHVGGDADIASLLAAGPSILSVPVDARLLGAAGYLQGHLSAGGTIAWGVVSTDGPISNSVERPWRDLTAHTSVTVG